jgi:hypothetical protein
MKKRKLINEFWMEWAKKANWQNVAIKNLNGSEDRAERLAHAMTDGDQDRIETIGFSYWMGARIASLNYEIKGDMLKLEQIKEEQALDLARKRKDMVYVRLVESSRAYGGHEEGGWWYDVNELVAEQAFMSSSKARIDNCVERFGRDIEEFTPNKDWWKSLPEEDSQICRGTICSEGDMRLVIAHSPFQEDGGRPRWE